MHDLSHFRAQFDCIAQRLSARGPIPQLDEFQALDQKRRTAISESEELKKQRNTASVEIGAAKRQGLDTTERQQQVRALGDEIAARDEQVKAIDQQFYELLAGIPNVPHESVPTGRTSDDNQEIRRWGEPREFDFTPKGHWNLGP